MALALGIALAVAALAVAPAAVALGWSTLLVATPGWSHAWAPFGLYLAAAGVLSRRPPRFFGLALPAGFWPGLDRLSGRLLGRPLTAALASASALMLATWVPHYLTWPWWSDLDYFAVMARHWDAGLRPYRDVPDFNFPGATEAAWLIGRAFGWGRVAPVYALDAAMLVTLGLALTAWSRSRFGRALPGLAGFTLFVCDYLNLDYALVAQRDWHATLLAVLGLLAPAWRPGRAGRLVSAVCFALAMTLRPYGVLFAPAILLALDEGARRPGETWSTRAAALALGEWSLAFGLALAVCYSPLIVQGLVGDFVEGLKAVRPGGAYSRNTRANFALRLADGLGDWKTTWTLAGLAAMAALGPAATRRPARTWAAAMLGVTFYKPIAPITHDYLAIPSALVTAVGVAVVAAGLTLAARPAAPARLLTLIVMLAVGAGGVPRFCSIGRSARAVVDLIRGRDPAATPLGVGNAMPGPAGSPTAYAWADYSALLDHLRHHTGPSTPVANLLRRHPFPAVNGPAGRPSPFPVPLAVVWSRWFGPGRDAEFARRLDRAAADAVVVWTPDEPGVEPNLRLPLLTAAVRLNYRPEARFGAFQVWRHRR